MLISFGWIILSIWSVSSLPHATISPVPPIMPLFFTVPPAVVPRVAALSAEFVGEAAQCHFAIFVKRLYFEVFLLVDEFFKLVGLTDADVKLDSFLIFCFSVDGDILEDFAQFGRFVLKDRVREVCDVSLAVGKN